ncbi:hypothetical protein CVT24_002978 [Panaeolus cyanescens]|uniref:Uncharacterized protein n=1 Tax=Panaeolus cyanescens TaxID=181874 RepID=A0A409VU76_9AGAR|nr:hypothetical protein CVT24_002978 [Panaeolus cyanescens]
MPSKPRSSSGTPRSTRSNSVSSASSSSSRSTKYVPLHKRPGSSRSSVASSSRPSSPNSVRSSTPENLRGVYSLEALLALRPLADEGMKQRMKDTCPDIVMNRRMRKSLQYIALHPHLRTQPQDTPLDSHAEEEDVASEPTTTASTTSQRALPRRNRPIRRAIERRRSVLQETWKGVRVPPIQPLPVS